MEKEDDVDDESPAVAKSQIVYAHLTDSLQA